MKIESCCERIKKAMDLRGLKQKDLCNLTGIPKSAMCQYLKGSYEPKQDRVYLLSQALHVSPAWLMGFDVPMQPEKKEAPSGTPQKEIIRLLSQLSPEDQKLLLDLIKTFVASREGSKRPHPEDS